MATNNTPKASNNRSLESIFNDRAYDITAVQRSQSWFSSQIRTLATATTPQKLVTSGNLVSTLIPGNMYLFFYDPKGKDTLPYYDKFPLILPFEKTENGFLGLNFHYLPPLLRVRLLDRLMVFKTSKNLTEKTRLRFAYSTIAAASRFNLAQPCIKRYLNSHVQSRFAHIPADQWVTAMMLPVERFAKSNKEAVWRDSRKKI